ncbi:hypothetical protein D3C84_1298380 [compost metagenome]
MWFNSFAWLFIPLFLMLGDVDEKHPFRNTFGVWFVQISLFLIIGVIGRVIYLI